MDSSGKEEVPVIPFLDTPKDAEKLRKMCDDLLHLATSLPTVEPVEGKSRESFLPLMPDPFPLPSLYSRMASSTGRERRSLFFRVARGSNCTYYAKVLKQGDDYHTLKVLSTDFPIKIDDLNISAVIKADELENLETGTLICAVVVGVQCVERNLVLSTKPELPDLLRPGTKLGTIGYKDLPAHYRLDQEEPKKPLHEFIEKQKDLGTEDCDKILEYLGLDPKKLYFTHSDCSEPDGNDIVQLQREKLSNEHFKKGLQLRFKKETSFAAEAEFKQALVYNPKNVNALFSLASLYHSRNKYIKALESIEAALELTPENQNYQDLLIKIIEDYLENDKSKDYDRKLHYSVRLCKLQNSDKKQNLLRFYLETKLTLIANPVWLEDFDIKEWNAKEQMQMQNQDVVDMELASDDGTGTLLESFKPFEKVKAEENQWVQSAQLEDQLVQSEVQEAKKAQRVEKTIRLVDYESDDNRSDSDTPSVEEISDTSMKHSNGHSSPKREERIFKSRRDYERSSYRRHRSSERSSSQRKQLPKRYDDSRHRFRDEDTSRRRRHSRDRSPSISRSRASKRSHYSPESSSRDSASYRERKHGLSSSRELSKRSYYHSSSREKSGRASSVKMERLSPPPSVPEKYYDLGHKTPSPKLQDPQKPQTSVPYPSHPSFKKRPAVSILNEVLDMIEDVRNEGK